MKIKAIEACIKALRQGTVIYDWTKQEHCNVGLLIQSLSGKTPKEMDVGFEPISIAIRNTSDPNNGTWTHGMRATCSVTGKTDIELFELMFKTGFTQSEIMDLEYCSNKAVLHKSTISVLPWPFILGRKLLSFLHLKRYPRQDIYYRDRYYRKQENLIAYLEAWRDLLLEQEQAVQQENYSRAAILRDELQSA